MERQAAFELLRDLQALYVDERALDARDGAERTLAVLEDLRSQLLADPHARPRILQVQVNDMVVGWLLDVNDIWLFHYSRLWDGPAAFSLSPALEHRRYAVLDGSSKRPVQWYFDNLLPEEQLLQLLAKQAGLPFQDAFGLLRHYGAESAGSLVLLPLAAPPAEAGLQPLSRQDLSRRVRMLEQSPLTTDAPKRMSLAGAQHKMVVVWTGKDLFEPLPGTPSTHILKPNSTSPVYPHSVINEYYVMRLAGEVGLAVPPVTRLYLPEPVYLIERFDRELLKLDPVNGVADVNRRHVIDTCQLLNTPRTLKYDQANLQTLLRVVNASRAPLITRQRLFQWLVFNVLVGNADNHLKNLSFTVSARGIDLAPHYDMLSTAAWDTPGYADANARWPATALALPFANATTFAQVTYDGLVQAAETLGLKRPTATRLLNAMLGKVGKKALMLLERLTDAQSEDQQNTDPLGAALPEIKGAEAQMLRTIYYVVIRPMLHQIEAGRP